jgi:hypothetical protein
MAMCCPLATLVSIGKVFIPTPQQVFLMFFDQPLNPIDLCSTKATAALEPSRVNPEFGFVIITFNVDVGRLIAVT